MNIFNQSKSLKIEISTKLKKVGLLKSLNLNKL